MVRRHARWDPVSAPRGRVTAAVVATKNMIPCHALMGDDWDHRAIRDPLTGDADTRTGQEAADDGGALTSSHDGKLHLQLHHAQQPHGSHNSTVISVTPGQCMTWDQSSVDLQSYSRTILNRVTNGFVTAVSRVILGGK